MIFYYNNNGLLKWNMQLYMFLATHLPYKYCTRELKKTVWNNWIVYGTIMLTQSC